MAWSRDTRPSSSGPTRRHGGLVEALTRTGADVTRASLVQHLEALRDFDTGVSPPVTVGINRRVGVQGAQFAALDVATGGLVAASEWIPLTP
ncbi:MULTISPECIES: hypothetical protein [Myxococcus]|nr:MULTISPECIES: hypothetical protein [Myxococcus]QZZ48055.1 hypothetical protein MyxoNM_02525 [Myxococcus xanthus]UYI15189.1 hypothetical protein N3T43_02520 [Myxococcus xanthus]UYI22553.1 hypothetical protein N1129_02520 [Myxococcus xanthus]SDX75965.1 hypothetical protein SAMN05444383_11264 [Myxococcus xanthus]